MSPMTDLLRRTTTLALVVVALVMGPQLAFGKYASSAAPRLEVGTATMVAPSGVTGTYDCALGWRADESLSVTVTGFADAGPVGATYVYEITEDERIRDTATSASRSASLRGTIGIDGRNTTWEFTITAKIGAWTSPAYRRSISCGLFSGGSGNL